MDQPVQERPVEPIGRLDPLGGDAGLYLHIPFCVQKCGYCDFFVVAGKSGEAFDAYVNALCGEIRLYARHPAAAQLSFDTIFVGGGTPSLLSPNQLEILLGSLREAFRFAPEVELTLEANPETLTPEKLAAYRALGVNRLSLGAQSFHATTLRVLDRTHCGADVERACRAAREAGFRNLSLDLIFGVPGQTLEAWMGDLEMGLQLQPDHLSVYSLTFEPKTALSHRLRRGEVHALPEAVQARMYARTVARLQAAGYAQYEISNFARPGKACRHNLKYWNAMPYLGLGVSAHSLLGGRRFWNVRSLRAYERAVAAGKRPVAGEETLGPEQVALERLYLGLRQPAGVDIRAFEAELNVSFFERYSEPLSRFFDRSLADRRLQEALRFGEQDLEGDLLAFRQGRLQLTPGGRMLADAVCGAFA